MAIGGSIREGNIPIGDVEHPRSFLLGP